MIHMLTPPFSFATAIPMNALLGNSYAEAWAAIGREAAAQLRTAGGAAGDSRAGVGDYLSGNGRGVISGEKANHSWGRSHSHDTFLDRTGQLSNEDF
jgi:hypothetical protein